MRGILKDSFRVTLAVATSMSVLTLALILSDNALAANVNDDPTDFPPQAAFTVKTNVGMGQLAEGVIGTEFFFDARASKDPEKKSLIYRWDFDGDGNYDTGFLKEPTISRVFWDMGTFQVKLAVRDENQQYDHAVQQIKIVRNTKPTAHFTVEPTSGSPAQVFRLNADNSYDDQYRRLRLEYRWDLNGDGVYDTDWSNRTTYTQHTYGYGFKGIQKVTLQVKDPENQRDTFTQNIEILENTVPVAALDIEPKIGTFETMFRFSADRSFDDETEFKDLQFRWDTDYNGPDDIIYDSTFSRSNRRSLRFNEEDQRTGIQKIRVDVKDKDGRIGSAVAYVELHWASPYLKILNDAGVIYTRYDSDFNPDTPVKRGEVVKMILKKLGININKVQYGETFTDVLRSNTNAKYIIKAKELGIVEGFPDGSFRPDASISRSETLAMILRAFDIPILRGGFQFYADVPKDQWFFKYVDTGTVSELVSGYDNGKFGPHDPITFGEIAKMLHQAGELYRTN